MRSNADVMVLLRDVPLEIAPDGLRLEPFDREEVRKLFDFLEFRTLHERLAEAFAEAIGATRLPAVAVLEAEVETIDGAEDARSFARRAALDAPTNRSAIEAAWDGPEGRSPLLGLAIVRDTANGDTGVDPAGTCSTTTAVRDSLRALIGAGRPTRSPRTASSR